MSTQNRRSSFSSSTTSSLAKRLPASEKMLEPPKKRAPLGDITNLKNGVVSKSSVSASILAPCSSKIAKVKKETPSTGLSGNVAPSTVDTISSSIGFCKAITVTRNDSIVPAVASVSVTCSMDVSPSNSDDASISLDETMSTCDSFKSPEIEYVDNNEIKEIDSINKKTFTKLYISDQRETENVCSRDMVADMDIDDKVINVDNYFEDPQLCATIACDIYRHLRASEMKKRASTDYMDGIQKDINASMRAILIDWLVEVAEEYRLVPDTLYLTVNYIDRYLSGNVMSRQKLQLLGVSCMMIAAKYEEICAPQVEEFCYITDNTYFKDEVLEMESAVLNYLNFELTAPTAKCFLRRFVRATQGVNEVPSMHLECMANYITELSLLEYIMLCHSPSLIAASAIFLAKYVLDPSKQPWNSTLQHYTLYKPSDLCECVKDLHRLCCAGHNPNLPAIREKYSQHKYKFVAKKCIPPPIPQEFFSNQSY